MTVVEPNGKIWQITVHVDKEGYIIGYEGEATPWLTRFLAKLEADLQREQKSIENGTSVA